jgi:signal peptidase II
MSLFLGLVMFVLDRLAKHLINKFVFSDSYVSIISFLDLFNIVNVRNSGVAFGMFSGRNWLFIVFSVLLLTPIILLIYKKWNKFRRIQRYAFCLAAAGGLSNFIDRLMYGAVIDFLDFGVNSLRWPSFNFADSCICVAVILILVDIIYSPTSKIMF